MLGLDRVKELLPWMLKTPRVRADQGVRAEAQYDHHAVLPGDAESGGRGGHKVGMSCWNGRLTPMHSMP